MNESQSSPDKQQRDRWKQQAAEHAVTFVESGMVVGLGAGSTAVFAVRHIGRLLHEGTLTNIVGIPCSTVVEAEARQLNIPLATLDDHDRIDVTIDGADEVDPQLNLIKGGGGALLREKMVAQASRRELIVIDADKLSQTIGTKWPVPVEIVHFGWRATVRAMEALGAQVTVRQGKDGQPFTTDQGNMIIDCAFGPIANPAALAAAIAQRAGVVEHGLFLGLATDLISAGTDGVRHITGNTK